jgi:hypothetical protein
MINSIIEKIRKNSQNLLLLKNCYNIIFKIKTDYTFTYKICDNMINTAWRRRRTAKSRKNYGNAKYFAVIKIEAIEKKSAAADEVKRKEKERY